MQPYQLHRRKHHSFQDRYAIQLDGVDEYLYRSESGYRGSDSSGSVSLWIKTSASSGDLFTTSDEASTIRYWSIRHEGIIRVINRNGGDMTTVIGTSTINDNTWKHIVITSSGTAYKLYINGVEDTLTGTNNGNWFADVTGRDNLVIGALRRSTGTTGYSPGVFNEVSVWNKELSLAEISEIYNGGTPSNLNGHSASNNMVSWWRCGDDSLDDMTGGSGTIRDQIGSHHLTPMNTEAGDKVLI